jgi:hypothetical protein
MPDTSSIDDSMKRMQEAAELQAKLSVVQMEASSKIQSAASTAQTVSGANAAGTETTKGIANDMRSAAKAA